MSTFYKESNDETSLQLFNKKIIYNNKVIESREASLVDFNFAEKAFYGKVDRDFLPIVLNPNLSVLMNFNCVADPQQNVQALRFVVDAFEALAQQFKKAEQSGKIYSNDPNLTNLKVYKSYKNYQISYQEYQNIFIPSIKNNINKQITNFNDFMKELLLTVSIVTKKFPMSTPAYTKSSLNSLANTGLTIEIADAPYDNDDEKISQFVNSKNWNFYVNACNSYGFMIDVNAPWRLIADLDSVAMLGYAKQYGLGTVNEILSFNFITTHNQFFNNLPSMMLQLYNEIVPRYVTTFDECGSRVIETERYTIETLQEKFSNNVFLTFYFNLRFSEEENKFSAAEKERIIKDCIQLAKATNIPNAIFVFEKYINQPFDYRGSLSYIIKAQRLREDT